MEFAASFLWSNKSHLVHFKVFSESELGALGFEKWKIMMDGNDLRIDLMLDVVAGF